MRHGERGDHADQPPGTAHVEQQADDEQDVVEAEQQMLDAEPEVGRGVAGCLAVDGVGGRVRAEQLGQAVATCEADAEQDIGQRPFEALDGERVAVERAFRVGVRVRAFDGPALDQGAGQVLGRQPCRFGAVVRKDRVEQQQQRAATRLLPDDLEAAGLDFDQLQVAGTDLVAAGGDSGEEPDQDGRRQQPVQAAPGQGASPPVSPPAAASLPPSSSEVKSISSISTL